MNTPPESQPLLPLIAVAIAVPTALHPVSPPGNQLGSILMAQHFERTIKAAGAESCTVIPHGEFNNSLYLVMDGQQQTAFRAIKDVLDDFGVLSFSEIGWEPEPGTFNWRIYHSRGNGELLKQINRGALDKWIKTNNQLFSVIQACALRFQQKTNSGQDLEHQ
jgi:hypothetical protein